jgi:hypothetical protein
LKESEEAEKRQKRLEKKLTKAGVVIAEDIPCEWPKKSSIALCMGEIGDCNVGDTKRREEYFKLEQEMGQYFCSTTTTPGFRCAEEQEESE